MKLLIGIASPRDIPLFHSSMKKLPYDKFWARYHYEDMAYPLLRSFFLQHTEYTHLAVISDDVIVKPEQAASLVERAEAMNAPVLTGVMMVNRDGVTDKVNVSTRLLTNPIRSMRKYDFMDITEYNAFPEPKPVVKVLFQGFAFGIVRRDVLEKIPLVTDKFVNKKPLKSHGCCVDNVFCWDCTQAGIPMFADLSVMAEHLPDARYQNFGVGKFEPYTFLESV